MTSTAIRERGGIDKFKQKQRKQNALRAEVKRSAGQKPREIPEDVLKTRAAFKQGIAATKGKSLSPTYQEAIKRVQETGRVEDFRAGTKDLLNQVRDEKAVSRERARPTGETFVKPKEESKPKTKDPSQLSDKDLYKAYSESSYSTPEGKAIHEEVKRRRNPKPNIVGQLEEGAKQAQKERVERFRNPGGKKNEPTMTIIPGSSRQPSKAAIKTKSGRTIRASIDSAHERGVLKALAFYAEANAFIPTRDLSER
jgi:hypothetical protein